MEIVTLEIPKGILEMLVDSGALTTNEFRVKFVEVHEYDYASHVRWKAAKDKADKAYKELKRIEFEIRNK